MQTWSKVYEDVINMYDMYLVYIWVKMKADTRRFSEPENLGK